MVERFDAAVEDGTRALRGHLDGGSGRLPLMTSSVFR
jgi:hypothetical protein